MKTIASLALILCAAAARPQSAPPPVANPVIVTARGCAAATVQSLLAPQWAAASSTVGSSAVSALESAVSAKLAPILAANPGALVTVFVNTSLPPSYVLVAVAPAGSSCTTQGSPSS